MSKTGPKIDLYTVPSQWVNDSQPPQLNPYRRIIGVGHTILHSRTLWATATEWAKHTHYSAADAERESIQFADQRSAQLIRFFNRFFVQMPVERRNPWRNYADYNCHRFAYALTDHPIEVSADIADEPNDIVLFGSRTSGGLREGEHGVIGRLPTIRRPYPSSLHSVVGLGIERPDCLQIKAYNGFMALDTYQNSLAEYPESWDGSGGLFHLDK